MEVWEAIMARRRLPRLRRRPSGRLHGAVVRDDG